MTDLIFTEMPTHGCAEAVHHEGFDLKLTWGYDTSHGAPWEEEDGHGPVSGWTTRSKEPGERVLISDGPSHRYYDFAEAVRIARRDGWDAKPYNTGHETPGQQADKAARADFDRLKAWCSDDWYYMVLVVTAYRNGVELGYAALGGVESDSGDYALEAAAEIAAEAIEMAQKKLAELCGCREAA